MQNKLTQENLAYLKRIAKPILPMEYCENIWNAQTMEDTVKAVDNAFQFIEKWKNDNAK